MIINRSGTLYAKIYWKGKQYWKSLKTTDPDVAKKLHNEFEAEVMEKERKTRGKTAWGEFCASFCKALVKDGKSAKTIEMYERTIRFFNQSVSLEYLDDLSHFHIDEFVSARRQWTYVRTYAHKVTAGGINRDITNLKAMTKWAEEHEKSPNHPWLEIDPLRRYKKLKLPPKDDPKFFTQEEMGAIWKDGIIDEFEHIFVSLYFFTGRRRMEITNLKRDQVDFKNHVIKRTGTVSAHKRQGIIPLAPQLEDKLHKWMDQYPHEYVLNLNGDKVNDHYATKLFKKIMKRAGVNGGGSLHRLRHTFGNRLSEANTNQKKIASYMGHSKSQTTDIYTNSLNTVSDSERAFLGTALSQ